MTWIIATFYKFVPLTHLSELRMQLLEHCHRGGLKGTILLAAEGINGTVAGSRGAIDPFLTWLQNQPAIGAFSHQEAPCLVAPFERLKIKLKKEIVTLGQPNLNPNQRVGIYVEPQDWNQLIADPEVILIDARNGFEVELGSFQGALNPHTQSFRELPTYLNTHLDPSQHKKVAMFCTGGIRCEKATAYLLGQGFEQVYQLKGGILNYLKSVPETESSWQGECFVFDDRVTVDHRLKPGQYDLCLGCGHPISLTDRASPHYEPGITCPHCYLALTPEKRQRLAARQQHRLEFPG